MAEIDPKTAQGYAPDATQLVVAAQRMTMQLSQMADQKASILMGATFVVFTVSIGQASRSSVPWALGILAIFAFASALLAVMAVLPRVTPKPDLSDQRNILFFGNFAEMSENDFVEQVTSQMHHQDKLFATILRDVHQNGQVLARRKYRFLALAYRTFIAGLTLSFLVFVGEWLGYWR